MSLFGSLYTAVSGLDAQSQATAIISNNIANVNTTGFKRSEAAFAALVTVESAAARYSPGAVTVNRLQRVDEQGQIAQTGSTLDVAIAGDGFFTVRSENSLDVEGDFRFTRNGQFNEDSEGILQNSAGQFLYGWQVDESDADPNNPSNTTVFNPDVSSLVPVDVSLAAGQSRVTTEGTLGLNLDADEIPRSINYTADDPLTPELEDQLVPFPTQDVDYSRTLRVYDSLGSAQDVTFEFIKIYGPQATQASGVDEIEEADILSQAPYALPDPSDFTVDINGTAQLINITATTTVNDVINQINAIDDGGVPATNLAEAYTDDDGHLIISAINPSHTLTLTDGVGGPLNVLGFDLGAGTITPSGSLPLDNTEIAPPFTNPVLPETTVDPYTDPTSPAYNSRGWWQVNVIGPNTAEPLVQGVLNFNSDGTLNARSDVDGNTDIELRNVDWGNGSEIQTLNINIDGITQFSCLLYTSPSPRDS